MPRVWTILGLVLALLVTPCLVSAQALTGCSQDNSHELYLTGAWVHSANVRYTLTRSPTFLGVGKAEYYYRYDAFQAGFGLPVSLGNKGEFGKIILGGTIAVPSSSKGDETISNGAGSAIVRRKWSADTYYATLEVLAAYPAGCGGWSLLGGFRWMYWQTSYSGPYEGVVSARTDQADVTANAYLPLVGIMGKLGGITVAALGIPTTLGTLEHKEDVNSINRLVLNGNFRGGYFAEVLADYTFPSYTCGNFATAFSVFCKANWLDTPGTLSLKDLSQAVVPARQFDFSFHRQLFFVGAKATINFSLSDLGLGSLM